MRRKLQITDTSAEEIEAGKSSESTVDESIIARNDKMSWIVQGTSRVQQMTYIILIYVLTVYILVSSTNKYSM